MNTTKAPVRRRITPFVPFTLTVQDASGDSFTVGLKLAYDINAFGDFKEVTGLSMVRDLDAVFGNADESIISAMLWAAVQENHPEYRGVQGLRDIRNLLTVGNLEDALKACFEAYLGQLPKDKAEEIKRRMDAALRGEELSPLATTQAIPATH